MCRRQRYTASEGWRIARRCTVTTEHTLPLLLNLAKVWANWEASPSIPRIIGSGLCAVRVEDHVGMLIVTSLFNGYHIVAAIMHVVDEAYCNNAFAM